MFSKLLGSSWFLSACNMFLGLTKNPLNRYQGRWHSMELQIHQSQLLLHCVPTVQLQLLQKCNQLQLITITNYHYSITGSYTKVMPGPLHPATVF